MTWTYSERRPRARDDRALAAALPRRAAALIAHCRSPDARRLHALGLPARRASTRRAAATALVGGASGDVEDLYPLSPLQQGMLFHALLRAGAPGVYVEQLTARPARRLDVGRASSAPGSAVGRPPPVLRTAFVWEGLDGPAPGGAPATCVCRWSSATGAGCRRRSSDARAGGLARGRPARAASTLDRAPLMRLALVRAGRRRHRLVWSYHHLLLDGWSLPLVLSRRSSRSTTRFARRRRAAPAARPRPYRDYIAWLRSAGPARRPRRSGGERSAGFDAPTPLGVDRPPRPTAGRRASTSRALGCAAAADRGAAGARRAGTRLTLNTAGPGRLGAAARPLQRRRTTWSSAPPSSGRPAELPGVESMVGLFINTLPVRVRVPPDETARRLAARRCRREQAELRAVRAQPAGRGPGLERGAARPAAVREPPGLRELPGRRPALGEPAARGLRVHRPGACERTNYPLTLVVAPGPTAAARAALRRRPRFDRATVDRLLRHLRTLLGGMAGRPGARRSASCRCSPRPSGSRLLARVERHRARRTRRDPASTSCSRRRRRARPDAAAVGCAGRALDLRASWTRGPNRLAQRPARAGRRAGGAGGRLRGALARSWWSACSASSRRAAPTCRSTRRTRRERLAFMLADAARRGAADRPERRAAAGRSAAGASLLDADWHAAVASRRRAAAHPGGAVRRATWPT